MKLTTGALGGITLRAKNRIALELDCSVQTVERWMKENENNGNLTKAKAVSIISEETGLNEQDILEDSRVEEEQK
jgi:hypothetical protein